MKELIQKVKEECFDNSYFEKVMGTLVNETSPDISKAELTFSNYFNKVVIGLSYNSTYKNVYLQYDKSSKDVYYSSAYARTLRDDNSVREIIEKALKIVKSNYSFKINIKPVM